MHRKTQEVAQAELSAMELGTRSALFQRNHGSRAPTQSSSSTEATSSPNVDRAGTTRARRRCPKIIHAASHDVSVTIAKFATSKSQSRQRTHSRGMKSQPQNVRNISNIATNSSDCSTDLSQQWGGAPGNRCQLQKAAYASKATVFRISC